MKTDYQYLGSILNFYDLESVVKELPINSIVSVSEDKSLWAIDENKELIRLSVGDSLVASMTDKDYSSMNEIDKLQKENARLKTQLKELRKELSQYKKTEDNEVKALFNDLKSLTSPDDNLEEKIDEVCSRTLCDRKEALDILTNNDYNVDKAITIINWSKLNVSSTIL